ncbi:MAG: hypothetical protein ACI4LX_05125 [Treponema sp.]
MKLIKKLFFPFLTVPLLFPCCRSEFDEAVFRNMSDPFYDSPQADSLVTEHTVYLSWKEDDAADRFYLMRSPDTVPLFWSCIYEGSGTGFTDTNLSDNERYVYRLDKARGQKYFAGKEYGYGWSSGTRKDFCEPNDTEQTAVFLEYDRICSLTCAGFVTDKKEFLDEDWFYVTVPPMRQADIVIGQHNLDNATAGAGTNLRIQVSGFESQSVRHLVACPIKNTGYETKNFYFRIFPERTSLSSGNTFCTVIEYTVSLNQIIKY